MNEPDSSRDDDYLWNQSGSADPDVVRLEKALAPFRYRAQRRSVRRGGFLPMTILAAACALFMLAPIFWIVARKHGSESDAIPYSLTSLHGDAIIEGKSGRKHAQAGALEIGDRIHCGAASKAEIAVANIGHVTLHENSRANLHDAITEGGRPGYRMDLEQGTLGAFIYAAPRIFRVGTPYAVAVDLGCKYLTTVDESGETTLRVTLGAVSFESVGRRVHVPMGAMCHAYKDRGPGTPVWQNADPAFRAAVERVDTTNPVDPDALHIVLATEKPRDSLTLWHLLDHHADTSARTQIYERLAALCPPPRGVTKVGCLAGEREMLDSWRERLDNEW